MSAETHDILSGDRSAPPWVAVLATCFNRKAVTLAALDALRRAAGDIRYHVYLVDDGSTDGTGDAVRAHFPEATVVPGDGTLFWNGGMRRAWEAAIPAAPSYYLWLNDDLELFEGSLAALLAFQQAQEPQADGKVITIGKVVDPDTGLVTYGGARLRSRRSRLTYRRVTDEDPVCDTMNGNCVLIPARAVGEIGILSDRYRHSTGDVDYGLRARAAGYRLLQMSAAVGHTRYNSAIHARRARLTWSNRHFILRDPKGLPVDECLYFCRTHGGWLWPLNFAYRYLKILRLSA